MLLLGSNKTPIDCVSSEVGPYLGHISILFPTRITRTHKIRVLSFVLNACAVQRLDANSLGTRMERFPRDRSDLSSILKHRPANDHLLLETKRFVRRLLATKFLGRAVHWRRNSIVRTMNHAACLASRLVAHVLSLMIRLDDSPEFPRRRPN